MRASRAAAACLLAAAALLAVSPAPRPPRGAAPEPPAPAPAPRSFGVADDRFVLDGAPVQLVAGSIHYFRIHPDLWRDRLLRVRALGLNAIQTYVPWNVHEPHPGRFDFSSPGADFERFLRLAHELGLLVLLRPGPYICAELDFGGLPWWLGASWVDGGGAMRLRARDAAFMRHVARWWGALLPRVAPLLAARGGPVLMVQMENEYGFCGRDHAYMQDLVDLARRHLGAGALLYTTDPPARAADGSLPGGAVLTTVDFGPGWADPDAAFAAARALNPRGASPPMCSEFYTGWLTRWGEGMANTSAAGLAAGAAAVLAAANGTGSLALYMAHGGTNFGFWAGANIGDDGAYMPHITSYDYDAPVSESGAYCQPGIGIGGECKFDALRAALAARPGAPPPPPAPAPPAARAYGAARLGAPVPLLAALPAASPGDGTRVERPAPMEEFGQRWGVAVYRTRVDAAALAGARAGAGAELDLGAPPHDYATVLLAGAAAGRAGRNGGGRLALPPLAAPARGAGADGRVQLDVVVEAMGRQNFGCSSDEGAGFDLKGLVSPNVTLGGEPLTDWRVFSLPLDAPPPLPGAAPPTAAAGGGPTPQDAGPVFVKGTFHVGGGTAARAASPTGHLPDTFLDTRGWGKGVAWVNGFNLGWYWASRGPQMTLYVPGPVLVDGANEVVLLEVEGAPGGAPLPREVSLVGGPDFSGPAPPAAAAVA